MGQTYEKQWQYQFQKSNSIIITFEIAIENLIFEILLLPHHFMNAYQFYSLLQNQFPFQPTVKQDIFFQKIAEFLTNSENNEIFVLKGYAGTGKTTVISTIVNNLISINKKYVLLAPTGRAAKVIANYSSKPAHTIHKKIYFPKKSSGGGVSFTLQPNKHKNTIFIVDESSMISDVNTESKLYENGSLLDDLISYV
jgi:GTPase SAR1 family protein